MPSTDEPGPARSAARVIGWLVVTPLMCLVIARLARLGDRSSSLFAIETLTIFAYLPAYFAFGMAVIQRQRALAGVAAVVMIAHIAWVAPDLRWWPTESDDGTAPFRVVAANLRAANTAPEDAARSIAELNADVLIATELTPALQRSLQ